MTPPLFVVDDLGAGDQIVLTGAEAHHAGTVKRLSPGEVVLLADGRGGLAETVVAEVSRDRVAFTVTLRRSIPPAQPRFVVVQALPKGERGELAVELLTELGVDEIVPWSAARSVAVWRGEKAARGVAKWQRTAREAAKQSRSATVPKVTELADTAAVTRMLSGAAVALVLHEDADAPLADVPVPAAGDVVLVIGPEGGLTTDELAGFAAAGARPVRLGQQVLRTSTAGAAALAVLSVAGGRWR